MKITKLLFASLTLGLLVASCQNGLEEVIDESAVQDEQATTRAEEEESLVNENPVLEYGITSSLIHGSTIVSGTDSWTYYATPPTNTTAHWSYASGIFSEVTHNNNHIELTIVNPNVGNDGHVSVYYTNNSDNSYNCGDILYVGVNGPHKYASSVRVLRLPDLVEAYPSSAVRLEANTDYVAYFSCPEIVSVSQWDFGGHATVTSYSDTQCYFTTDSQGWCNLVITGSMSQYNINKTLLDVILYGQ